MSLATGVKVVGFLGEDQNSLQSSLRLAKAGSHLATGDVFGAIHSVMEGSDNPMRRFQTALGLRDAQFDGKIRVKVYNAKGLTDLDDGSFFSRGGSDPYVQVKVDGVEKGRTKVADDPKEPVWNQVIEFDHSGPISNIDLELWDDDISTDDFLGHVVLSGKDLFNMKSINGPKPLEAKVGGASTGEVHFTVEYIPPSFDGKLTITVNNADGLPNSDLFGKSDPFAVVSLDNIELVRTQTQKNNANPVWNEEFVRLVAGPHSMIYITVWDEDVGSDDLLGSVEFRAKQISEQGQVSGTFELSGKNGQPAGQINLTIAYTPPQLDGPVTVLIKNAVGIADKDFGFSGESDAYVVVSVDGKEVGRTQTLSDNNNPVWNEEISFDVVPENKYIHIHVMDDDVGADESLGFVRISAIELAIRNTIEDQFILRGDQGDLSITGQLGLAITYNPNHETTDPALQQAANIL